MILDFSEVEARINHMIIDHQKHIDRYENMGRLLSKLGHIDKARRMDDSRSEELSKLVDLWRLLDDLKAMAKE